MYVVNSPIGYVSGDHGPISQTLPDQPIPQLELPTAPFYG